MGGKGVRVGGGKKSKIELAHWHGYSHSTCSPDSKSINMSF